MYVSLILITFFYQMITCGEIRVDHGEIDVSGYSKCTIKANGVVYEYSHPTKVPGLWFGLISYKCGKTYGALISEPECKECGLFCSYNEVIPGCKQIIIPLSVGIITGIIIGIIIMVIIIKFGHRIFGSLWYKIVETIQKKKDRRVIKEAEKMIELTGRPIERIPFKNYSLKNKNKERININRTNQIQKRNIITTDPEYIEVRDMKKQMIEYCKKGKEINNKLLSTSTEGIKFIPSTPTAPTPPAVPISKSRSFSSVKSLTIGLLAAGLIDTSNCCDSTLYLMSSGKICNKLGCTDTTIQNFPLMSGQTICFRDIEGEILSIKIKSAYYRNRYTEVYKTSDISIETNSYYVCKGSGECWNGGCNIDTVGERYKSEKAQWPIYGYKCNVGTLGCDTWCWHQSSCTYYRWSILEKGPQYSVYKYTSNIWEVDVEAAYKGLKRNYKLNVNNPSINVENIGIKNIKSIPMMITGFTSEKYSRENGLIKIEDKVVPTKIADVNFQETDIIGDYQIDLRNDTRVYDEHNVVCFAESCKPVCQIPQPKIRRLINKVKGNLTSNGYVSYKMSEDKKKIEHRQHVNAIINVIVGNVEANELYVSPAQCDINIKMTYGCEGCNINPYIIFEAYNIKSEGTMQIDSNCTFQKDYISCNLEPYMLQLEEKQEYCFLIIPSINYTRVVNFKFLFLGKLDPMKAIISTNTEMEDVKEFFTSGSFIKGLTNSLLTFSIVGILGAGMLRAFKIYQFHRGTKEALDG